MDIFLQQILNGLVLGSIYALIALGYTMVYGIMGLINFAHGEVVMFGAMVTITVVTTLMNAGVGLPGPMLVLIGRLVAIPACMLLGYTIERVAYRPLRNAPKLAPLITAIGLSIVLQQVAILIWGRNYIPFPAILDHETIEIFGATITKLQLGIVALCLLLMVGLLVVVEKTKLGRAIELEAMEFKVLLKKRHDGQFQIARNGFIADYNDATNFLAINCKSAGIEEYPAV